MLVVKTKEQALAQADAILAPAEATQRLRTEERFSKLYLMYPGLRVLSDGEPQPILNEAARYARRQWVLYVPIAVMLACLAYLLYTTKMATAGSLGRMAIWAPTLCILVTTLIKRRLMRTYIKGAAAQLQRGGFDQHSTTRV